VLDYCGSFVRSSGFGYSGFSGSNSSVETSVLSFHPFQNGVIMVAFTSSLSSPIAKRAVCECLKGCGTVRSVVAMIMAPGAGVVGFLNNDGVRSRSQWLFDGRVE
jgi:hypothetical protein